MLHEANVKSAGGMNEYENSRMNSEENLSNLRKQLKHLESYLERKCCESRRMEERR